MSLHKFLKPDGVQIGTALLLTNLIIALLLGFVVIRDSVESMLCKYMQGGNLAEICPDAQSLTPVPVDNSQVISSKITSACVDQSGLKISVEFAQPLAGEMNIQIFSTGEDYFPSQTGISDMYVMNDSIPVAVDNLEFIIPVEDMPAGAQIFGNIMVTGESSSSQVAYFIDVRDCLSTSVVLPNPTPPTPNLDGAPVLYRATCLPDNQLMITFEFEGPVLGQYQALVADIPYQLASVASQPAMLFFFGERPSQEPVVIKLVSATDQVVVFEEVHTSPACGSNGSAANNPSGDIGTPSSGDSGGSSGSSGGDDGGEDIIDEDEGEGGDTGD